jgi:ketosteroid isomerase-like protein
LDEKESVIRLLAEARRRGDFETARSLVADDMIWHEPGGEAMYSGDHRGGDTVVALWQDLAATTGGTFVLEPAEVIVTDDHAAARTRWWAEREGHRVEGNEIGVYRFDHGRIAEAWFWYDGYDPIAHDAVFASGSTR